MRTYYFSIGLTIAANVLYHFAQKSISSGIHPIVSIITTYITALIISLIVFWIYPNQASVRESLNELNWQASR